MVSCKTKRFDSNFFFEILRYQDCRAQQTGCSRRLLMVVLGLAALRDSTLVYIGEEKDERND